MFSEASQANLSLVLECNLDASEEFRVLLAIDIDPVQTADRQVHGDVTVRHSAFWPLLSLGTRQNGAW